MIENNTININQSISVMKFDKSEHVPLIKNVEEAHKLVKYKEEDIERNNVKPKLNTKKDNHTTNMKFDYDYESKIFYKLTEDGKGNVISTIPDIELIRLKNILY